MDDLISRQEAIDILTRMSTDHFYGHRQQEAFKLAVEALSAERQGRWVDLKCDQCGQVDMSKPNYCPNCGARMEV